MRTIKIMLKSLILMVIFGFIYMGIEIAWRGFTHWSMGIVGGLAGYLIGTVNNYFDWEMPLWKQMGIGTIIVTVIEFISGCIVNLWLGWDVWNYSYMPLNILGQVCLPFCFLWFLLSFVAILIDDLLRWALFKERFPKYKLF